MIFVHYLHVCFNLDYFQGPEFLGATDSAVPCSMLLDIAQGIDARLAQLRETASSSSLKLVFFDGEEAFGEWLAVVIVIVMFCFFKTHRFFL